MSASIVNFGESRAPSDKLSYGTDDWTAIHSATATALSAGPAAVAQAQHYCAKVTLSYSAAPAVSVFTIKDGTTVIFQAEISASAPFVNVFDFQKRPLRASIGAALTANVGSAGGAIVQTIIMEGFTLPQGTQTSV